MKYTFNGCSRSNFTVSPKNWKSSRASTKKPWRIYYRFYDPSFRHDPTLKDGKECPIRRMNRHHDLVDRQAATKWLLKNEQDLLDLQGYNPITTAFMAPATQRRNTGMIDRERPFIGVLWDALAAADIDEETRIDIRSTMKYFDQSARMLGMAEVLLKDVLSGDIMDVLDNCKNLKVESVVKGKKRVRPKVWNANQYNHYRKYLGILFGILKTRQVMAGNPVDNIPKKQKTEELSSPMQEASESMFTAEEVRKINAVIKAKDPDFHRFIHIFKHSGARRKEIMKLKGQKVDLQKQGFWVFVKKRKTREWVWKTIPDIALPYWQEAMAGCGPDDYVFSTGLRPGAKPIRPEQATRRWLRHVKSLGIRRNLYDLKKQNTTEVTNAMMAFLKILEEAQKVAAEVNSHTTSAMVIGIYDKQNALRTHEAMKAVNNPFTG